MRKPKVVRWLVTSLSIALFIASLTQDAYYVNDKNTNNDPAFLVLLTGWLGLGIGGHFSWLANPLLILSWVFYLKQKKDAVYLSIGALLLAASFMCYKKIVINEAGFMGDITGYGRGYWLWLASIGLMPPAIIVSRRNMKAT